MKKVHGTLNGRRIHFYVTVRDTKMLILKFIDHLKNYGTYLQNPNSIQCIFQNRNNKYSAP